MEGYTPSFLALALVSIVALLVIIGILLALLSRSQRQLRDEVTLHRAQIEQARQDSVDKSRSTLKGKLAEQMVTILREFPYVPADARFIGDPIDYVIFPGYTDIRDSGGERSKLEIVFLEIKQGRASLSPVQKAIADAVIAKRVRFQVGQVNDEGVLVVGEYPARRGGKRATTPASG